jgi:hypothetical protein
LEWKTFKLIPNLQTIKPKSSLSTSPISISITRWGNRGGDVHKTRYGRARREKKRKRVELTLSTTEASILQRETSCGTVLSRQRERERVRAREMGRLEWLPRERVLNFCFKIRTAESLKEMNL